MHSFSQRQKLTAVTRNDALEFATRTLKNLEALDDAKGRDENVHVVTQLANSLLGLIVFTVEKNFDKFIRQQLLTDLEQEGWPHWEITTLDSSDESEGTKTLGELVRHLRNAVAHGRVHFYSDSPTAAEVSVQFEDARPRTKVVYWKASLSAPQLRSFCANYVRKLHAVIG